MPGKKKIIHKNQNGQERGSRKTALLIIDVISDFEFEDGVKLYQNLAAVAPNIARLKQRVRDAGLPVIYVNDNYGKWQEDFRESVAAILKSSEKGGKIARILKPGPDDLYVLKPQRSAFYETPLDVLLASLGVTRVILTGVSTDICILFTGHDAYMRGMEVVVPPDCTAAVEHPFHDSAIEFLERVVSAEVSVSDEIRF